ncbi:MAG: DUF87 domain-containing protein [Anaerolineae bacterium]|nr:DUF87 domain-containing protein [Anaerolineae bacterium]
MASSKQKGEVKGKSSPVMARKPRSSILRKTAKRSVTSASTSTTPQKNRYASRSGRKNAPSEQIRRSSRTTSVPRLSLAALSPERRLDILGVVLTVIGVLTLIAMLSSQRAKAIDWWITTVHQWLGWGALVLPAALIVIGAWFILRNIEQLPQISVERMIGIALLFLNFLAFLHIFLGKGWQEGVERQGGGKIGWMIERLLVYGLGRPGALVALTAWLMLSLIFIFDLTVYDLIRLPLVWGKRFRLRMIQAAKRTSPQPPQLPTQMSPAATENGSGESPLPPNFIPLKPISDIPKETPRPPGATRKHPTSVPPEQTVFSQASIAKTEQPATPSEQWELPSVTTILDPALPAFAQTNVDHERARLIEETLKSFGAPAHVIDIQHGPTITLFGVEPDYIETRSGRTRVRVGRIAALADDLALALAAERIRIQAPVPGRNYVGIEVPNTEISRVSLIEIMESESFKKLRSPLKFALGKNVSGKPIAVDLTTLPHLLIAGTTGSGKSVCVNAILSCLLLTNTPQSLRLVLVDPKRVELTGYNGIPHLLAPTVVEAERVIGALQWMLREMDSRYHKFAEAGVRNIQEYNAKLPEKTLPYLVIVIDELADLMMIAPDETERSITRLAQLARATGIHLILATQRPSVDVVTGLIKANFPARVSFAVASGVDSRVILDQPGAERLLGRGDMLYQAPDASAPIRLQGVYVAENEIHRLVSFWRLQSAKSTVTQSEGGEIVDMLPRNVPLHQAPLWDDIKSNNEDPLLDEAIDLVRREGRASITMLQRRMRIGYTRAARLIDRMEENGIIGPALPNSQVREVLDYGPAAPPPED